MLVIEDDDDDGEKVRLTLAASVLFLWNIPSMTHFHLSRSAGGAFPTRPRVGMIGRQSCHSRSPLTADWLLHLSLLPSKANMPRSPAARPLFCSAGTDAWRAEVKPIPAKNADQLWILMVSSLNWVCQVIDEIDRFKLGEGLGGVRELRLNINILSINAFISFPTGTFWSCLPLLTYVQKSADESGCGGFYVCSWEQLIYAQVSDWLVV